MPVKLDKITSAIMYYLVSSLDGVLGKTHLQKLLFLTDLLASKKYGEPLTKMNYIRYTHGPYSNDLNDYIKDLISSNLVEERQFPMMSNPKKHYSRFHCKRMINAKDFIIKKIGADKMLLINEVVQSYGNKSLQEVLDFVYSLEEVANADFKSPIKLAQEIKPKASSNEEDDIPF